MVTCLDVNSVASVQMRQDSRTHCQVLACTSSVASHFQTECLFCFILLPVHMQWLRIEVDKMCCISSVPC